MGDTGAMTVLATRTLISLLAIMFVDRYYALLDCRMGIALATVFTTSSFFIYSLASSLAPFLLGAVAAGLGYGLGGMVGMTILTRRWYSHDLGAAVGFASVGSGVASIFVPMAAVRIIEATTLGTCFRMEAGLAITIGIIVVSLLKNSPQPGKTTASTTNGKKAAEKKTEHAYPSKPASELHIGSRLSDRERNLVIFSAACMGIVCVGGPAYATVYYTDSGIAPVLAATLLSVQGACLTVSKYATGKLFDLMGTRRASAIMFAAIIAGLFGMCLVSLGFTSFAPLAAVLFGTGLSLGTVGISVWSLEMADPKNATRSIKNFQVAYAIGGFLTNTFPGPLKEMTGSYLPSFAIMLAVAILSAFIVLGTYARHRRASSVQN